MTNTLPPTVSVLATQPRAKSLVCLLRYKLPQCPLQVDHQYTNFSLTQSNTHFSLTTIPVTPSLSSYLVHFHSHYTSFTSITTIPTSLLPKATSHFPTWTPLVLSSLSCAATLPPPALRSHLPHRINISLPSCTRLFSTIRHSQTSRYASATGLCMRIVLCSAVARSTSPTCSLGVSE